MTVTFEWPYTELRRGSYPYIPIRLASGSVRTPVLNGLIDSGSDLIVIPEAIATYLGLKDGDITTAMDTAGGRIKARRGHVDVELLCKGKAIGFRDVEVAVVDMKTMPVLIGRHPVFTTFDVLFQERKGVFSLSGTR